MKDICPTVISAVLLRLFHLETGKPCAFDALDLLSWWVKKIDDPYEADEWITSAEMWRNYARHIHALVAVNIPCIANEVAYDLGIENPLIPWPEIITNSDGTTAEFYSSPQQYGRCLPPFGFEVWQPPLALTRNYTCEEGWFDSAEDGVESEQLAEV
ncbi:MAG TPA: hypothetical protein PK231_07370 [Acidocella sp.]|nr:hypothetical protein [Acidocella sp.]